MASLSKLLLLTFLTVLACTVSKKVQCGSPGLNEKPRMVDFLLKNVEDIRDISSIVVEREHVPRTEHHIPRSTVRPGCCTKSDLQIIFSSGKLDTYHLLDYEHFVFYSFPDVVYWALPEEKDQILQHLRGLLNDAVGWLTTGIVELTKEAQDTFENLDAIYITFLNKRLRCCTRDFHGKDHCFYVRKTLFINSEVTIGEWLGTFYRPARSINIFDMARRGNNPMSSSRKGLKELCFVGSEVVSTSLWKDHFLREDFSSSPWKWSFSIDQSIRDINVVVRMNESKLVSVNLDLSQSLITYRLVEQIEMTSAPTDQHGEGSGYNTFEEAIGEVFGDRLADAFRDRLGVQLELASDILNQRLQRESTPLAGAVENFVRKNQDVVVVITPPERKLHFSNPRGENPGYNVYIDKDGAVTIFKCASISMNNP